MVTGGLFIAVLYPLFSSSITRGEDKVILNLQEAVGGLDGRADIWCYS